MGPWNGQIYLLWRKLGVGMYVFVHLLGFELCVLFVKAQTYKPWIGNSLLKL